jgi:hypothetical protein
VGGDLILEFLNAAHGDAILVSWGSPPRLAVVDGGPTQAFELGLGPRLRELRAERTQDEDEPLALDLLCVSHIDDDHVGGIIRLLTDLRRKRRDHLPAPYRVERLWHNSLEELISAAPEGVSLPQVEAEIAQITRSTAGIAASVNQGREVRDLGRALGVAGNKPFGTPVTGGLSTALHGLNFTIIAPDQGALDRLEKRWREAKRLKDAAVLAAAFADRSVPNLSSISLVVGEIGGCALLTADARGDRVMAGLEALELLAPAGTIHFDVLQVPHHGSANNVDQQFFERVTADHYVISADGIAHAHPDLATLEWIVNARGSDGYMIHLTNPIPLAEARLRRLAVGRNFLVEARGGRQRGIVLSIGSGRG